jgi:hypothetical protein
MAHNDSKTTKWGRHTHGLLAASQTANPQAASQRPPLYRVAHPLVDMEASKRLHIPGYPAFCPLPSLQDQGRGQTLGTGRRPPGMCTKLASFML